MKALFFLLAAAAAVASAEPVQQMMPACTSEEYLSEFWSYQQAKDKNGLGYLFVNGHCTILDVGTEVSVIRRGVIRATVRYKGVKLFTPSEALQKGRK